MSDTDKTKAAREAAAAQRKDYVRALREERAGCEAAGKESRVAAIDAELERMSKPGARRTPEKAQS